MLDDLARRTAEFVRREVLPVEDAHDGDIAAAGGDHLRVKLQAAARAEGVFAPHVPVELGGHGLTLSQFSRVFEAAGHALFGPLALNAAAPDEGNIHLLHVVAGPAQREQFLVPLASGEVRSAFAMTEPEGAGSDPSALTTPAESGACLIHGDHRIDNAILDAADPTRVLAVVDWELATLGDPLTDLALMGVYRHPSLDVILGLPAAWTSPRLPDADGLAELYATASGRELANWPFYRGLAHLKLAVIAEGIAYRAHAGADAGRDAARAADAVPELVAAGLKALG